MKSSNKKWFLILQGTLWSFNALAQNNSMVKAPIFPSKSIRIMVPFPAGGGTDFFARLLGQRLTELWGQPVIIDNRSGAGGVVGTEIAARAAPDGYTYLVTTAAGIVTNPLLISHLNYSMQDFSPVSLLVTTPLLLVVNSTVPIYTVKDLITAAKTKPNKINYATSGSGSANHLSMELLKSMASIDLVHIPYKGTGPAVVDLVSGQVEIMFNPLPPFLAHIKTGRLRPIAVAELNRSPLVPDIPTFAESGVAHYQYVLWYGIFSPAKTSNTIIAKMNDSIKIILSNPNAIAHLATEGAVPQPTSVSEFIRFINEDRERVRKVIQIAGIKKE